MKRKVVALGAVWILVPWTIQIVIERRRRARERAADDGRAAED